MMGKEDLERVHKQIAMSAIDTYRNDLKNMTPEQIEQELNRATDEVNELTAWQEALAAAKEYGV